MNKKTQKHQIAMMILLCGLVAVFCAGCDRNAAPPVELSPEMIFETVETTAPEVTAQELEPIQMEEVEQPEIDVPEAEEIIVPVVTEDMLAMSVESGLLSTTPPLTAASSSDLG